MGYDHNKNTDRLLRYAAVASITASGGMLLPTSAQASGVIREINVTIDNLGIDNYYYDIDFDNDGHYEGSIGMFATGSLGNPSNPFGNAYWNSIIPKSFSGDAITGIVVSGGTYSAAVLDYGDAINVSAQWYNGTAVMYDNGIFPTSSKGNWNNVHGHPSDPAQGAYLGLRLKLDGNSPYYGWIELYQPDTNHITIKRLGYSTVAGQTSTASVTLSEAQGTNSIRTVVAGGFAALSGALTWLRRKLGK